MNGDFLLGTLGAQIFDEVFFEIIGTGTEGVMHEVIVRIHVEEDFSAPGQSLENNQIRVQDHSR